MGSSKSHLHFFNSFNIMASFEQISFAIYWTKAALFILTYVTFHRTEALLHMAEVFAFVFNVFNLQSREWHEQSRRLDPIYYRSQVVGLRYLVILSKDQIIIFQWGDIGCLCFLFLFHGLLK